MPSLQVPGTGTVIPSLGQRASFRLLALNERLGFYTANSVPVAKTFHLSGLNCLCKVEAEAQASEACQSD